MPNKSVWQTCITLFFKRYWPLIELFSGCRRAPVSNYNHVAPVDELFWLMCAPLSPTQATQTKARNPVVFLLVRCQNAVPVTSKIVRLLAKDLH